MFITLADFDIWWGYGREQMRAGGDGGDQTPLGRMNITWKELHYVLGLGDGAGDGEGGGQVS